jgi:hypothetical protein
VALCDLCALTKKSRWSIREIATSKANVSNKNMKLIAKQQRRSLIEKLANLMDAFAEKDKPPQARDKKQAEI